MDMGMEQQILSPGMQNTSKSGNSSEMLWISRELLDGIGSGRKQKSVQRGGILGDYRMQFSGNGEYNVEVPDIKNVLTPSADPLFFFKCLTFGTVAVSA